MTQEQRTAVGAIRRVLREGLVEQNGFICSDGTVYMGSARSIDIGPLAVKLVSELGLVLS